MWLGGQRGGREAAIATAEISAVFGVVNGSRWRTIPLTGGSRLSDFLFFFSQILFTFITFEI